MGRSNDEAQRLARQAELYAPLTRRLLVDAGIASGARVLEVGSGAGHVALLLADIVGPTGSIVGIESNGDVLEVARANVQAAGVRNVTFVEADVRTMTPGEQFDAVVGRFI